MNIGEQLICNLVFIVFQLTGSMSSIRCIYLPWAVAQQFVHKTTVCTKVTVSGYVAIINKLKLIDNSLN